MPVRFSKMDSDLLEEVQRLGVQGLTQGEIASRVGMTDSSQLRYRLSLLGFRMQPGNVLKTTLTDAFFSDLLQAGEIQTIAEETAEVSA
jgi:hypothetical protein